METRIEGKLKTWRTDQGFGFIVPLNGGQDIFVHISEYPRVGGPPKVGESLLFEVALNEEGKKKAINVLRPGQVASKSRSGYLSGRGKDRPSLFGRLISVLLLVAFVGAGYKYWVSRPNRMQPVANSATNGNASSLNPRCDGRIYCSQMTSCEEAKFFLQNCPDTEMDGDRDGVPCESQWCSSPFSKW